KKAIKKAKRKPQKQTVTASLVAQKGQIDQANRAILSVYKKIKRTLSSQPTYHDLLRWMEELDGASIHLSKAIQVSSEMIGDMQDAKDRLSRIEQRIEEQGRLIRKQMDLFDKEK